MGGATIWITKVTVLGPRIKKHHTASDGFVLDHHSDMAAVALTETKPPLGLG